MSLGSTSRQVGCRRLRGGNGIRDREMQKGKRNRRTVFEIQALQWKVDDGRVLLLHEEIFGESFEMQDDIGREPLALESLKLA